jgi:hypothetical protein
MAKGSNLEGIGIANFDGKPSYPSYALFLTSVNALILQEKPGRKVYVRVGLANFLGAQWRGVGWWRLSGKFGRPDGSVREILVE